MNAEAMREQERYLTTGCSKLDAMLKGGIPCRGITQIYGAAGTGKTQLALQLCLTVQLPIIKGGLGAGNNRKNFKTYKVKLISNRGYFITIFKLIVYLNS